MFGGAIALRTAQIVNKELSMVQKKDLQIAEKQAIARYAASLIERDDCVYLDAGTSTGWMIEYIREAQATYVTNALSHAKRLADKGFHVILIGGEPKSSTDAIVGAEAVVNLQKYHFSKGFFGTNGVEQNGGFTTPGREGSDGQADCGEKYAARKPLFPGDVFQIRESVRRNLRRLRGRSDPDGSARAGKSAEERQGCQCEPTGTIKSCLRRHRAIEGRFYRMKVMFVNGSSHLHGTTMAAIEEMEKVFRAEGIETEVIQVGGKPIADCLQCNVCGKTGKCVFTDDGVNEFVEKAKDADGFVFATPVYFAHPSGRIFDFLDRAFYSSNGYENFKFKPGAAVAIARRGGTTASLDALNKYFGIAQMPTAGSTYWNMVHGLTAEDAPKDEEGMQTMRNLAKNMIWMMRCFEAGKKAGVPYPDTEKQFCTNFIR